MLGTGTESIILYFCIYILYISKLLKKFKEKKLQRLIN